MSSRGFVIVESLIHCFELLQSSSSEIFMPLSPTGSKGIAFSGRLSVSCPLSIINTCFAGCNI